MKARSLKPHSFVHEDHCEICKQQKSSKSTSKAEIDTISQKISDLIGKNPEKAALILEDWIHKSVKSSSNRKR